jgi:hypothetical protein
MIPTAKAAAHRDDALTFFSMVNRPFPGKIVSKRQKTLSLRPRHLQSFFPAFAEQATAPSACPRGSISACAIARGTSDAGPVYRSTSGSRYGWVSLRTHTSSLITTAHSGGCALAGKTEQPRPFAVHHTAAPSTTASNFSVASGEFLIPTLLFCRMESESKSRYSL